MSELREHWDRIYSTKAASELSWHQDEPSTSLHLVEECLLGKGSVIDIGGGSSILAGELVMRGFAPSTVVDISSQAIQKVHNGIDPATAAKITWLIADVLALPELDPFDVWHDRAVFHFLTNAGERAQYVRMATNTVRSGGFVILGTFSPEGPEKCIGVPVCRYDSAMLTEVFAPRFRYMASSEHINKTPCDAEQSFVFTVFQKSAI